MLCFNIFASTMKSTIFYFTRSRIYWILLVLILLSVTLLRLRLLNFPLERDEGEFAYMGQLILQGIPPYSEAANMKLPGTYYMYALMMAIFGQSTAGIHFGFLMVNLANIVLMYQLSRKLLNSYSAIFAAATYAILSYNHSVLGFAAHATHFVVLAALGGFLLLLKGLENNRLPTFFWSGFLLGIAFIMKQPGLFFILFALAYINWNLFQNKPLKQGRFLKVNGTFIVGSIIPFAFILLYLSIAGVYDKFSFWVFEYALKYGSATDFSYALKTLAGAIIYVTDGFLLLWIIALAGLLLLLLDKFSRKLKIFILLLFIFSFISLFPGYYFRPHYFVMLLPTVALLVGLSLSYCTEIMRQKFILPQISSVFTGILYLGIVMIGVFAEKDYKRG